MRIIITLMLLLFIVYGAVYAETITPAGNNQSKKIQFYVNTGFSKPNNPTTFLDFWNIGYNVGGGIGYLFHDDQYALIVYADYSNFGFDRKEFKNSLGTSGTNALIDGGKLAVTSLSCNIKHMLERSRREMAPYIIGGLGFTITSLDDVIITREEETDIIKSLDTGTDPFVSAGFGVNISVKNLQIFGEIRFQIIFQEDESLRYFPFKAGVVF